MAYSKRGYLKNEVKDGVMYNPNPYTYKYVL